MNTQQEKATYAARTIRAFLSGLCGKYDWDDFTSSPLNDLELDSIRRRATAVDLPVDDEGEKALLELANEADRLAEGDGRAVRVRTQDLTRTDAIIIGVIFIFLAEFTKRFGGLEVPPITGFSFVSLAIALRICWPMHKERWFAPLFFALAALQIPIYHGLNWLDPGGFYISLAPIFFMYAFAIVWLVLKLESVLSKEIG
jgi:hypothetical protein